MSSEGGEAAGSCSHKSATNVKLGQVVTYRIFLLTEGPSNRLGDRSKEGGMTHHGGRYRIWTTREQRRSCLGGDLGWRIWLHRCVFREAGLHVPGQSEAAGGDV